jgi:hypothetical protein
MEASRPRSHADGSLAFAGFVVVVTTSLLKGRDDAAARRKRGIVRNALNDQLDLEHPHERRGARRSVVLPLPSPVPTDVSSSATAYAGW